MHDGNLLGREFIMRQFNEKLPGMYLYGLILMKEL